MSALDTATTENQAKVLRLVAGKKHPKLELGNIAINLGVTLPDLQAFLNRHGYPDAAKLYIAAIRLDGEGSAEQEQLDPPRPTAQPAPTLSTSATRPATTSPSSVTSSDARPIGPPDEIRVLINTAKGHPSKRIQAAGNRLMDDIDKLRTLIREDQEKNAARAEVRRLEQQLQAAKAKLKKKPVRTLSPEGRVSVAKNGEKGNTVLAELRAHIAEVLDRHGVTSKDVRTWAAENGVDCPLTGSLPARVVEAYDAAHPLEQDQAS